MSDSVEILQELARQRREAARLIGPRDYVPSQAELDRESRHMLALAEACEEGVEAIKTVRSTTSANDDRFDSLVRRLRRVLAGAEQLGGKRTIQRIDELLDSAAGPPVCITPPAHLGRSRHGRS